MDAMQVASLIAKTQDAAVRGKYELYKTTTYFDSTIRHPEYLGGDTREVHDIAPMG